MLITFLLASLAAVPLVLLLLTLPVVLLQRFVSGESAVDEVEERWLRRFGDGEPPFLDSRRTPPLLVECARHPSEAGSILGPKL
jgi:hypothetical protein